MSPRQEDNRTWWDKYGSILSPVISGAVNTGFGALGDFARTSIEDASDSGLARIAGEKARTAATEQGTALDKQTQDFNTGANPFRQAILENDAFQKRFDTQEKGGVLARDAAASGAPISLEPPPPMPPSANRIQAPPPPATAAPQPPPPASGPPPAVRAPMKPQGLIGGGPGKPNSFRMQMPIVEVPYAAGGLVDRGRKGQNLPMEMFPKESPIPIPEDMRKLLDAPRTPMGPTGVTPAPTPPPALDKQVQGGAGGPPFRGPSAEARMRRQRLQERA